MALKNIKTDHKICATCGNQVKITSHPSEEWVKDRSQKHERLLDNGGEIKQVDGELTIDLTECYQQFFADPQAIIGFQYTTEHAVDGQYGIECECGNVDLGSEQGILRSSRWKQVLENIVDRLHEKEREGRLNARIPRKRFYQLVRKTGDIEYSVGKALEGRP